MTRSRFLDSVIGIAFLLICGCGGGNSTRQAANHLVAAAEAIKTNDKDRAFAELSASIDSSPSAWAYFERARLDLEKGQEDAATADCQSGLALDSTHRDLMWLSAELKKPAAKRFKGKLAKPPGLK